MRVLALLCVLIVADCANVTVTQVNDEGMPREGAVKGFYVPRLMPYLLVADLPPDETQSPKSTKPAAQGHGRPAGGHAGHRMAALVKPKENKGGDNTSSPDTSDTSTPSAPASASDLSFLAVTKSYVMKLIYLPDYSHQQAISTSSGLFGKATLNLQLTDGALTSLQANMDSTENGEVFKSALTAAVTAASGGAAGMPAAAKDAATKAEEARQETSTTSPPILPPPLLPPADSFLHPGLYKLSFDDFGKFIGLQKITGFCPQTGLTLPNNADACTDYSKPPS